MDAKMIEALAELAWPLLAAVVLLVLLPTIIRVTKSRAFTIKYGDMEVSVQDATKGIRKQIEDLQNQVRALTTQGKPNGALTETGRVEIETKFPHDRTGYILWVDDHPENNAYEIAKLQEDGFEISTEESTKAALTILQNQSVRHTLVISDMGRREGLTYRRTGGLDLIREIRSRGIEIPIYIYTSKKAVRRYSEQVQKEGGNGITASPMQLFRFIDEWAT